MARPPIPVGTFGEINKRVLAPGKCYAEAQFRMANGRLKRVRKYGKSKTAATAALKKRMVLLATEVAGGVIDGTTRMEVIIGLWLKEIEREVAQGGRSADTLRQYRGYAKNWVKPAIGELQACEAELMPMTFDQLVQRVREKKSYDAAKSVKSVCSSVCAFGIRNGAMKINPVKSGSKIVRGEKKAVLALTVEQRIDLRGKLVDIGATKQVDTQGRKLGRRGMVWLQLPDLQDCMLSTGGRIGELLALDGDDVIPAGRRVLLRHHLVRVGGEGLVRVKGRKGHEEILDLRVPEWSVPTWRRLKLASGGGPLFPSFSGGWLDPNNATNRLREAFDLAGYVWVTSHVWRKTVSDVLKEAGLPTSMIADQLGNTEAVVEKHYRKKHAANQVSAEALESMMTVTPTDAEDVG